MTAFTYTIVPALYAREAYAADERYSTVQTTEADARARMEAALRAETEAAEVEYDDDAQAYAEAAAVEYMRLVREAAE